MKENLPFDDYVKAQFSNYSPPVPEHIWRNITVAKRTKPKGFWMNMLKGGNLLLLSLLLLSGGGVSYLLLSSANNNSETKNIPGEKNIPNGETANTSYQKDAKQSRSETLPDIPEAAETAGAEVQNGSSVSSGNLSNQYNFFTSSSRKPVAKNTDTYGSNSETNKKEIFITPNNSEINNTPQFSPFRVNNARELPGTKILNFQNIKLPDCPTIEKNAAGNKKYWEVYAGPDYAFENYKGYSDTASNNYLQQRKASTKFASAFSAGVRYTKVFNNGTSVRAGVNYTQINEKFLYFNPNEIKYVTVITTRVIIRSPGDTVYINDTLQYQQTGTRVKTTYNRYRNIDIPLVIGYELGNGKIHANINAGIIINVYSWYKGDVLDSLYQPVTITTGKGNSIYQYKNNIGVGFLGSVSVYYKLTDKLHLVVEPYFRYNLSPMSKSNLNLQQKYHIAGLRAGVRLDLK